MEEIEGYPAACPVECLKFPYRNVATPRNFEDTWLNSNRWKLLAVTRISFPVVHDANERLLARSAYLVQDLKNARLLQRARCGYCFEFTTPSTERVVNKVSPRRWSRIKTRSIHCSLKITNFFFYPVWGLHYLADFQCALGSRWINREFALLVCPVVR